MTYQWLIDRTASLLRSIPPAVTVVAAAKTRQSEEIKAVIAGGISHIGFNFVQEAARIKQEMGGQSTTWRMIGHLQRNKLRSAARIFDTLDTLDSYPLAARLESHLALENRILPVLIEVNSAREPNKSGVMPEDLIRLAEQVSALPHLRLRGIMTMGPVVDDPQQLRPAFRLTSELFRELARRNLPNAEIIELSMGMSDSFQIAIEEGATMVRIGTLLFGARS